MDKQRDIWDKVEAIIKIVSIFVLIYTTYKGSEKIATSLEKGKLVQSLIADLSSRESSIRQDVALIALNRSVEKDDTLLVAEIAERLFEDVKDSGVLLGRTAYKILKERRPAYAEQVKQNSQKNLSDSTNRSKNISAADTSEIPNQKSLPSSSHIIAARIFDTLVYIQFRGDVTREKINELRQTFLDNGYNAPGVERIDKNFKTGVRYFNPEDKELAESVAALAKKFFENKIEFSPQNFSGHGRNTQIGQIELWLNYNTE